MVLRRVRIGGFSLAKAGQLLMLVGMLILLPAGLVTIVWLFDIVAAPPVLQYFNSPLPVKNPRVTPGQSITLIVERCSLDPFTPNPLVYTYTRELVNVDDGSVVGMLPGATSLPHGCQVGDSAWQDGSNTIPNYVDPGTYYIRGTATALGRLKVGYVQFQSDQFEVRPQTILPPERRN